MMLNSLKSGGMHCVTGADIHHVIIQVSHTDDAFDEVLATRAVSPRAVASWSAELPM